MSRLRPSPGLVQLPLPEWLWGTPKKSSQAFPTADVAALVFGGLRRFTRSKADENHHELRLIPWLPEDVENGIIVSYVAGFIVLGTLWGSWWCRLWPSPSRERWPNWLARNVIQLARLVVFATLFWPLCGGPALIWVIVWIVWVVVSTPFRLIARFARWVRTKTTSDNGAARSKQRTRASVVRRGNTRRFRTMLSGRLSQL